MKTKNVRLRKDHSFKITFTSDGEPRFTVRRIGGKAVEYGLTDRQLKKIADYYAKQQGA